MIIIDGQAKPNLVEWVVENTRDIERVEKELQDAKTLLGFDIKVIGVQEVWEEPTGSFEYGDAILVGPDGGPYVFHIYTRSDEGPYWLDFGEIGIMGPEGPKGDKGDPGAPGASTRWYVGSNAPSGPDLKEGDCWLRSSDSNVYIYEGERWMARANIRGLQGIQGVRGPQGPKGIPGEQGPVGPRGAPAPIVEILGMLDSAEQLPEPGSVDPNAGFLITDAGATYLYIIVNGIWSNSGRWGGGTSVYVNDAFVETFDADNYGRINNKDATYQRIPCIAGTADPYGRNTNQVSQWLTPDFTLGSVSTLGTNQVLATYTSRTGTRNIGDTASNSRHLWTSTPTKDFHCVNKKYVDEKIAAAHEGGFQPHARIFAVNTENADEPPQYTVYAGLVADTWDFHGFINFPVESLVIYNSGTYTPMAGPYTLFIERTDSDYIEGVGSPIQWGITNGNVTHISGDGYATQSEYEGENQIIKLKLRVTTGADEAYIQITQYPGTSGYVHY